MGLHGVRPKKVAHQRRLKAAQSGTETAAAAATK
jgi:hypothetical protein